MASYGTGRVYIFLMNVVALNCARVKPSVGLAVTTMSCQVTTFR